ncbi:unannotated protein [freshwater metagenome]|uniref:Unannotated protein n=1 Tax=freshwater metagenome TaxID=449393 RepID=A0A6J6PB67_9ZZZZ|nr:hypothetical protein [Actinomycetota bacterium]MSY16384.1 hypothetical protein [Actinomycetota bacterium]
MPSFYVAAPAISAPTDRLALGVGWVRPGAGNIGGGLNPATPTGVAWFCAYCFEGSEE